MAVTRTFLSISALALVFIASGCNSNSQQAETQKKIDELQKQLDDTKKELDASGAAAKQAAESAAESTKQAVNEAAQKTTAAAKKAATGTSSQVAKNTGAIADNAGAIAANKSAIGANKTAIDQNRADIATNREGVAEAKRMAAPAPYHTLDAGTPIVIRTTNKIYTKNMSTGSTFEASLEQPLEDNGYVIAPRGASVEGVISNSDPGGRVKGVASITVAVRRIIMQDGRSLAVRTSSYAATAKESKGKDAMKVGIASGIGAAIGAIAGGGKGAAIGAGAGAAGGTGMVLGTRGAAAEIAPETVLTLKLAAPVSVQELKR